MLEINCPYCGKRAQTEFTYVGDASLVRPKFHTDAQRDWFEFVYLRKNPLGLHDELWQHSAGCRQHIKIRRNLITHEIVATGAPDTILRDKAP